MPVIRLETRPVFKGVRKVFGVLMDERHRTRSEIILEHPVNQGVFSGLENQFRQRLGLPRIFWNVPIIEIQKFLKPAGVSVANPPILRKGNQRELL